MTDSPTSAAAAPPDGSEPSARRTIHRVQTGVRLEKRLVKVTKAVAEYLGMNMGDLLEGVLLHAFEGKAPFSDETISKIATLKEVYGLDLDASDSHHLIDAGEATRSPADDADLGGRS